MAAVESATNPHARRTVLVLGFATAIAQALLLREAMAAMGGSELAWGSVMAMWLIGMGVGARCGVRWGTAGAADALPSLVIGLTGVGAIIFRAAPALTGAAPGETITTWHALWLWAAAVLPSATAGGLAFPILATGIGDRGAGRAYTLEAVGALIGGLTVSFVLAPFGTAAAILSSFGGVSAIQLWHRSRALATSVLAVCLATAVPAGSILASAGWRWAGHPGSLGKWKETRQQRIDLAAGHPASLYADGRLLASYPDPYSTVPWAHLLMLMHPDPERVITLGCLADGAIQAMARHRAREIVAVEEDPLLARLLPEWYGLEFAANLRDPGVRVVASDPLRVLPGESPWDLVILRDGNPTTIRHNRTRTVEFFRVCHQNMAEHGVLIVRLQLADTYLGGSAGRLLEIMSSTLRQVFPQVVAIPGEEVHLVAGRRDARLTIDPAQLENRYRARGVTDQDFFPEMIALMVDPSRAETLNATIRSAGAPINTIDRPRAVLLAAGLAEARSRSSLLNLSRELEGRRPTPLVVVVGVIALVLLGLSLTRRPPASATAAVVGLCSMGWWLLLIASWQSTLGSVYAEIGALTAAFMGGLAGGSSLATQWKRPARNVPFVLAAGLAPSLLIAAGAQFLTVPVLVPLMLAACGFLTGAAFPGIAELAGRDRIRRGAGIAFAADEVGAAGAAFFIGILALPWAGLSATALGLVVLELAAIPAVIVAARK
jgi:spermidine synthase